MIHGEFKDKLASLVERVNSPKSRDADLSKADKDFVFEYYPRVTGRYFHKSKCSECFKDAIIQMNLIYNKTKQIDMKNSGFKLRNGVVLHSQSGNGVLSFKNLTDERAIAFIVEFAERKVDLLKQGMFAAVPDNYDDLIVAYYQKLEDEANGVNKEPVKADNVTEATTAPSEVKTPVKRTRTPKKSAKTSK